jgi:hypothetical protein
VGPPVQQHVAVVGDRVLVRRIRQTGSVRKSRPGACHEYGDTELASTVRKQSRTSAQRLPQWLCMSTCRCMRASVHAHAKIELCGCRLSVDRMHVGTSTGSPASEFSLYGIANHPGTCSIATQPYHWHIPALFLGQLPIDSPSVLCGSRGSCCIYGWTASLIVDCTCLGI